MYADNLGSPEVFAIMIVLGKADRPELCLISELNASIH